MPELLHSAAFGLPVPRSGKVRDVYDLGDRVLIVATDRISAFDAVMENGIPEKGMILNQMSAFWFRELSLVCPNHMISIARADLESLFTRPQPELIGRSMIAKKATTIPIECVARGYISGTLFKEYRQHGRAVLDLDLPDGLVESDRLPEPIFTPATKAESGHDVNIRFAEVVSRLGSQTAEQLKTWTLELYSKAAVHALAKGIILADTKFEFGITDDGIILIDEALTPDSSRFWDAASYAPGKAQASFDKQFVRDFLEESGWDKTPPGPALPDDVRYKTREKYAEAFRRITGTDPVLN